MAVLVALLTLALHTRVLMVRVDLLEDRLREEQPQPKTSNWSPRSPFRACGCACHKARP